MMPRASWHPPTAARRLISSSTPLTCPVGAATPLARLGAREAIDVLTDVLERLDPGFTRAETTLRIDLAQVFTATGEKDAAAAHAERARLLAAQVGSVRQRKRLATLVG